MQLEQIRSLIFDFDGTLATCPYDFKHMRRCILETAAAYGLAREELESLGLLEAIEAGAALLADQPERAAAFRRTAMRTLGEIEYEAAAKTRLLPGMIDALEDLRARGYGMGVVTRNSRAAVERILGESVLPVAGILSRDDVPHPKPHLDHAYRALRLLGASAQHTMMVGDHPTDIEMGRLAGMATVAVLTGQTREEDLRSAQPDLVLPSVIVLAELLAGITSHGSRND